MRKDNFNKNWTINHGLSTIMDSMLGGGSTAEQVTLPHDAMINMKRSADAVSGPGMAYFEGEDIEYVKQFVIPSTEKDKVHYLNFDGVYMNATFTINGVFMKKYRYGYTPCTMRIDKYLKYDQPNILKVMIRGSALPNGRWYPGEGIYRDTWLLTGDYLHVAHDGLHVTTLDCGPELGVLEVKADIRNVGPTSREAYAKLTIKDQEGNVVSSRKARFYVDANAKVLVRQRVDIENPKLWNVDTPNLYTCECVLEDRFSGEFVDAEDATFGIRKLQLDAKNGLRINGQSVKLKGGCIHHDNGLLGAVSVADAEERRIRIHKEGGYNAFRTAHNPPSTALLDACDRLGMLVMHEFTDVWTETKAIYDYGEYMPDTWEEDVENVVRRDFNHPCVIMWSIGNEIPETGNPIATQWGRKLVEKFKSLDSTRFVTNGINVMVSCIPYLAQMLQATQQADTPTADGVNDVIGGLVDIMGMFATSDQFDGYIEESCDMLDLIGYNYTNARYEREHPLHPEWVFFGSETFPGQLDVNWDTVSRNSYVIGDFCWTSMDYLGEVGCGRIVQKEQDTGGFMGAYPWLAAADGDFDLTGFRKPMSYWREIIWGGGNHKPYIAVHRMQNFGKDLQVSMWNFTDAVNSWTWPGYEGKPTAVEVYSDAEEVELFINGVSQGKKPVGDDFKKFYCRWDTVYAPGELLAVAYIGGEEVGRYELKTAGKAKLCVTVDKKTLRAGSSDLCYVEIELRDENGVMDMTSAKSAKVQVEGAAVLAGCGSANPCTEERYCDTEHLFFEGRMLAILRASDVTGKTVVTVTSEGIEPASVEIEVI